MIRKGNSVLLSVLGIVAVSTIFIVAAIGGPSSWFHAQLSGQESAQASDVQPSGQESAQASDASSYPGCPPLRFFGARGSGEKFSDKYNGYGPTISSLESKLHALVPGLTSSPVKYPAISIPLPSAADLMLPPPFGTAAYAKKVENYRSAYTASVSQGVRNLLKSYSDYEQNCPGHPVVFAGYSQGVDVVDQAYYSLSATAQRQVILVGFGDPHFNPTQKSVDQGDYNKKLPAILVRFFKDVPHSFSNSDASHVQSWCFNADTICNFSWANLASCGVLLAFNKCTHEFIYVYTGATSSAAWWAYNAWMKLSAPSASSPLSASPSTSAPAGTSTWTVTKASLPTGYLSGKIDSVSCPSVSECIAVGGYTYGSQSNRQSGGLLLTGSHESWTAIQAPAPGNAATDPEISLTSVSCPTTSYCVAVGDYLAAVPNASSSSQSRPLVLTWSGGSWTATEAPLPADTAADYGNGLDGLQAVACASTSHCIAVGNYSSTDGYDWGMLLTDSGGTWTAAHAPLPADALITATGGSNNNLEPGASLGGVSCPTTSYCVAVGNYVNTTGYADGLLLTDSGGTWTADGAPLPADAATPESINGHIAGGMLYSVSCPSASHCVAAGIYNKPDSQAGLLLTDSEGTWTAAEAPVVTGSQAPTLRSVSCSSASDCVAVGEVQDSTSNLQGLLLTDSGGSWTAAQAPLPSDAFSNPSAYLYGVSCPSATDCVAGGGYSPGGVLLLTESG